MKGTAGQLRVPSSYMKQIQIPFPPVQEQHRIVNKIEELFTKLDAGIDSLIRAKLQLKQYRQSLLKYAFEGRLTQQWRESHKGEIESAPLLLQQIKEKRKLSEFKYKELKQSEFTSSLRVPKEWIWIIFSMIIKRIKRGPSMKCNQEGKGIRYITSGNLEECLYHLAWSIKYYNCTTYCNQ
jgi:type I restriction enzyme S subunit